MIRDKILDINPFHWLNQAAFSGALDGMIAFDV